MVCVTDQDVASSLGKVGSYKAEALLVSPGEQARVVLVEAVVPMSGDVGGIKIHKVAFRGGSDSILKVGG